MRLLTIGVLCGVLLVSGCTRQEVNQYSVIAYEESDETEIIALKSAGNLVPWLAQAVACAAGNVIGAAFEGFGARPTPFKGWGSALRD